jgi:hypothetical protein
MLLFPDFDLHRLYRAGRIRHPWDLVPNVPYNIVQLEPVPTPCGTRLLACLRRGDEIEVWIYIPARYRHLFAWNDVWMINWGVHHHTLMFQGLCRHGDPVILITFDCSDE